MRIFSNYKNVVVLSNSYFCFTLFVCHLRSFVCFFKHKLLIFHIFHRSKKKSWKMFLQFHAWKKISEETQNFKRKFLLKKKETEKKETTQHKLSQRKRFSFFTFLFFFFFWVKKRSFDLFIFFQVRSQKTKHLRRKKIILWN